MGITRTQVPVKEPSIKKGLPVTVQETEALS